MIYSQRYNFCFIHIYKTGGTSIREALSPFVYYNTIHRKFIKGIKKLRLPTLNIFDPSPLPNHSTSSQIESYFGHEFYNNLVTFAVVRNPYDWMLSLYTYRLKMHHPEAIGLDFREFIQKQHSEGKLSQLRFISAPQSDTINVKTVLKFENLKTDFSSLTKQLGMNAHLQHKNKSRSSTYYKDAYDAQSINLVKNANKILIDKFNYEF